MTAEGHLARRSLFPRALVLRIRMRDARHALAETDLSVRDVARAVGYGEAADFGKAFGRYHGISPTRYRQQQGR